MPAKSEKKKQETPGKKDVHFKCKCCGENKLLNELVTMRQFFPPISVCASCARSTRTTP